MKLTKDDIGTEVILLSWHRGLPGLKKSTGVIKSIGRVNLIIGGNTLRICEVNEFSIKASARHESDQWVKIFRNDEDIKSDERISELKAWFDKHSDKINAKNLSVEKLERIRLIINEK
jgi:hypothetical protein